MKQSPQNTMLNSLEIRRTSLQSSIEVSVSVWPRFKLFADARWILFYSLEISFYLSLYCFACIIR